jgi:sugar phosphate permease
MFNTIGESKENNVVDIIYCSIVFVKFFRYFTFNWKIIFLTEIDKTEARMSTRKQYKEDTKHK